MNFETIDVRFQDTFCFLKFNRLEAKNAITNRLVDEVLQVAEMCEESVTVLILEGSPEYFCFGADFEVIYETMKQGEQFEQDPEPLYNLWLKLATGPYITVSHVRGKANAGGVGFVAASDIVIADSNAQFSLSELLFGLFPACVLPFLKRKIGLQKAHYMSLMTQPISAQQAYSWGLVDALGDDSELLLRKHFLRLKYISKTAVRKYKKYISMLDNDLVKSKELAVEANRDVFSDPENLNKIFQFIENMK